MVGQARRRYTCIVGALNTFFGWPPGPRRLDCSYLAGPHSLWRFPLLSHSIPADAEELRCPNWHRGDANVFGHRGEHPALQPC